MCVQERCKLLTFKFLAAGLDKLDNMVFVYFCCTLASNFEFRLPSPECLRKYSYLGVHGFLMIKVHARQESNVAQFHKRILPSLGKFWHSSGMTGLDIWIRWFLARLATRLKLTTEMDQLLLGLLCSLMFALSLPPRFCLFMFKIRLADVVSIFTCLVHSLLRSLLRSLSWQEHFPETMCTTCLPCENINVICHFGNLWKANHNFADSPFRLMEEVIVYSLHRSHRS